MRAFDFSHAIVRTPGKSVVNGIRSGLRSAPGHDGVSNEHRAYVEALRAAGVHVDVLAPLENYPDSVFVEDTALVFPEGAILLRPGAPARLGESAEMRAALERHFHRLLELGNDEYADGGDILVTPQTVFIGASRRTNRAGAAAVRTKLEALGRKARIVETPENILHFKSAVSLLDEDTILATAAMAGSGIFQGMKILTVPDGEEEAANALRVNDTVLVGDRFPRTLELLGKEDFHLRVLPVTEIAKLDAGLSCMSLRWRK